MAKQAKGNPPGENHRFGTFTITTLGQLRKALVKILNTYWVGCADPLKTEEARCLGFLAGQLRHTLLDYDLEQRLEMIERHLSIHGGNYDDEIRYQTPN